MRWLTRGLCVAAAFAAVAFSYLVYATLFGTPLSFGALLDRQAAIVLLQQPELLVQTGIVDGSWLDFTNGNLGAYSLQARSERYEQLREFRAEIQQWDRSKLRPQEQLSYDMLVWSYSRSLANERYGWLGADGDLYPVNQAFGVQKSLPNSFLSDYSIVNARSARNYVARLVAMGALLDALRNDVERQARLGVIPPDFVIDDCISQMNSLIELPPSRNVLVANLARKSAEIGLADSVRRDLVGQATAAVRTVVYPAYRRLIAEESELRRRATHDAGVWRLKDGNAYYADQLKSLTSTDLMPDEIHSFGLEEVARVTMELDLKLRSVGLVGGSVGARLEGLMSDPKYLYANNDTGRVAVLSRYRLILGRAQRLLPRYFSHVPKMRLDVQIAPRFAEQGSAVAYYNWPSFNGSRPGIFFVNLRNVDETPTWAMPTLAFHEGVPGHHLQTATALENPDLPALRRLQFMPAFDEGWALYAERLAAEIGLYKGDPYGDIGRLQSELFRAARLVVDTGIHAKHWSREYAIAYLKAATGLTTSEVTEEVERYAVWPGQACAYTIGMREILGLRARAMAQIGPRFDMKQFHAHILENGALPLWLLRRNLVRWIAAQMPGTSQPDRTFDVARMTH